MLERSFSIFEVDSSPLSHERCLRLMMNLHFVQDGASICSGEASHQSIITIVPPYRHMRPTNRFLLRLVVTQLQLP